LLVSLASLSPPLLTLASPQHYAYFDREGNKTVANAIACDGEDCGVDCWEESYFLEEEGLDLCVSCYKKQGLTGGEYQREGIAAEVSPPSKKKQKTST